MSGEIESAADVVTGAVLARAVEPETGEGGVSDGPVCLNCSARLSAAYCGSCGQKAHVHRTLAAFAHDALHSLLHLDGKAWRTLPLLAWKPGQLTRRYVHGERAKFVSPLALLLLCVFLAFAVFGWSGSAVEFKPVQIKVTKKEPGDKANTTQPEKDPETAARLRQLELAQSVLAADKSRSEAAAAALQVRLSEAQAAGVDTRAIEDELSAERVRVKAFDKAMEVTAADLLAEGLRSSEGLLNDALARALGNPQLLVYKLQSNAYKFAWALVPLSLPFVWLLFFWKREYKVFDHAVFVTYSLCFMLLLATLLGAASRVPALEGVAVLLMIAIPPLHMYRQVRHAYVLSAWSAAWRTGLLLTFANTALALFAALVLALGVRN